MKTAEPRKAIVEDAVNIRRFVNVGVLCAPRIVVHSSRTINFIIGRKSFATMKHLFPQPLLHLQFTYKCVMQSHTTVRAGMNQKKTLLLITHALQLSSYVVARNCAKALKGGFRLFVAKLNPGAGARGGGKP